MAVLFARIGEQTSFCELCPVPPVAIRSVFHKSEASLKNVPSLKLASLLGDTGSRCCCDRAEPGRAGVSCSRVFSQHHMEGTWAYRLPIAKSRFECTSSYVNTQPRVLLPCTEHVSGDTPNVVSQQRCGAVARASDSQLTKPGSNPHCFSSRSCINEYLTIDSDGYVCTNGLCALIAAWLNASQRSRDGSRYIQKTSLRCLLNISTPPVLAPCRRTSFPVRCPRVADQVQLTDHLHDCRRLLQPTPNLVLQYHVM